MSTAPATPSPNSPRRAVEWARPGFWVVLAMLSVVSLAWVTLAVRNGSGLTHEAGLMTGLAMDTTQGQFYRPLIGPGGYGGTRYGPLHILLQAALIEAAVPPLVAGQILVLVSGAALYAAVSQLLLLLGLRKTEAAAFPLLLLVSTVTMAALAGIRPDLLAVALNAWGLVFALRHLQGARKTGSLVAAIVFFTAALLAKFNAGAEFATAVLLLLAARRFRSGLLLGAATAVGVIVGFIICNALSHGRLWENYAACANPGGRPRTTVRGWLSLLQEVFLHDDWPGTLLAVAALGGWLWNTRGRPGVVGTLLIVTVLLTLPMYFSPGLSTNHLLDLQLAAVLTAAVWIDRNRPAALPWLVIGLVALLSLGQLVRPRVLSKARYARLTTIRRTLAGVHVEAGVIFSDNALVPVSVGQRPFLLDDFMFPAVRQVRPSAETDLLDRLQRRWFSAVVLRYDPTDPGRAFALGAGFAPALLSNYRLTGRLTTWDHLWIYQPRPR